MANLSSPRLLFFCVVQLMMMLQSTVQCFQYKVGDLSAWGIPTAANPDVYTKWSKNHIFRVRDSLLFLYPPSQDSVLQVTPSAYKTCNLKDPILGMNDGNSLFNITQPGEFYFISGKPGHCQKGQKLHISLAGDGAIAYAPAEGPSALSDTAGYTPAFGSIPTSPSPSPSTSSPLLRFSAVSAALLGLAIWVVA